MDLSLKRVNNGTEKSKKPQMSDQKMLEKHPMPHGQSSLLISFVFLMGLCSWHSDLWNRLYCHPSDFLKVFGRLISCSSPFVQNDRQQVSKHTPREIGIWILDRWWASEQVLWGPLMLWENCYWPCSTCLLCKGARWAKELIDPEWLP